MSKEVLNAIFIKLGFIVDPTVHPDLRNKTRNNNRIIYLALIIHLIIAPNLWGTACLIQGGIGFPCPTCGTTRAINSLLHGNISQALNWHPLVFVSLIIFFAAVIGSILREVRKQKHFKSGQEFYTKTTNKVIWFALIPIFSLYIIVYVIRLINVYPEPPLNYNFKSALGRFLSFLNKMVE